MAEVSVKGLAITAVAVHEPGDEGTERGADLRACRDLRDAHHLAKWGNLDRGSTLREDQEYWRGTEYEERLQFLARLDGVPAGTCSVVLPLKENTGVAWIEVLVDARFRRQGIGRRLLAVAEEKGRGRERKVFEGYCEEPVQPWDELVGPDHEELPAKSGSGGVPLNLASTRFALACGYELEQVERSSRLALPVDPGLLATLEAGALVHARGYRVVGWEGSCPAPLVDAYAVLKGRMSADVPTAGLEAEIEEWDAARVRDEEQRWARSGVIPLVAAVQHAGTGELAAYTVLSYRPERPHVLIQEDTLVAGPHRGHRLGLLVKIANIRRAQEIWPAAASVITWNASENRHMLAINISLGFKPAGFEGEWQKRLE
ncbi:GNAT family N-acetyltransferase [Arthrobacter sp. ISL-72]|uniref:GNAT family N-acetyltransferase n=1 Tax=Arthrobacter sp. ISL-72 TaxID=2819114 RepID=UPI001BE7EBE1|nr:GNAT family N-acetyltransferase [Arthrobacter sp. ISL-72]MBT2594488.1 GNAT family N-acetyltransferase [Arthrobacter sp. ISL-72]